MFCREQTATCSMHTTSNSNMLRMFKRLGRVKISSQSNDKKQLILIKKAELKKEETGKDNENLQDMCKNRQGLQQKKEGICKIYYLWVTVIAPDICQILQETLNGKLKMVLFRKKK